MAILPKKKLFIMDRSFTLFVMDSPQYTNYFVVFSSTEEK